MNADDPAVLEVMRRSMVARIATLSRNGRPSINPLYFVYLNGHIWLGTVDWTLAARNVKADPRVSVLFEVEQDPSDQRVLRIRGQASVRTDQKAQRSYNLRAARKYILTPGGIRNALAHIRQLPLRLTYAAQSTEKGQPCVIEVTPLEAEFLNDDQRG
jgi:nitroimidazol reductase NimA-like FMN-containing flavoprotein (pyridoxamine 5'-phosphate oxidase superfamily)